MQDKTYKELINEYDLVLINREGEKYDVNCKKFVKKILAESGINNNMINESFCLHDFDTSQIEMTVDDQMTKNLIDWGKIHRLLVGLIFFVKTQCNNCTVKDKSIQTAGLVKSEDDLVEYLEIQANDYFRCITDHIIYLNKKYDSIKLDMFDSLIKNTPKIQFNLHKIAELEYKL